MSYQGRGARSHETSPDASVFPLLYHWARHVLSPNILVLPKLTLLLLHHQMLASGVENLNGELGR